MTSKINEYLKTGFFIILLLQFVPPVLENITERWQDYKEPKNKIGYLSIKGPIMSIDTYRKHVHSFLKNPDIKALFLNIDSPGGAAGASQALALDIINLKKEFSKPVIAYSENVCASGAYYIASAADVIITPESCIVGSIGSRLPTQFELKELLEQYHVKTNTIATGNYKTILDPFCNLTEEQKTMLQSVCDDCYEQFTTDIAQRRNLHTTEKHLWADGKIFTGKQALHLKLVDYNGSKTTAVNILKERILPAHRKITWIKPPKESPLQKFLKQNDTDGDDTIETTLFDSFFGALFRQWRAHTQLS